MCMCTWYLKCGYLIIPSLLILLINWLIISHDSMQILLKNNDMYNSNLLHSPLYCYGDVIQIVIM